MQRGKDAPLDPRSRHEVLEVQIFFGEAGFEPPAISDSSDLIGHTVLSRGMALAAVANARGMDIHTQRIIEGHSVFAAMNPRQAPRYGWGTTASVPLLIDLAALRRTARA